MAAKRILIEPAPILRIRVPDTNPKDKAIPKIVKDMWDTIEEIGYGIAGLAANQIGYKKRILLVVEGHITMINPVIVARSDNGRFSHEGCFSIPGYYAMIPRSGIIKVAYVTPAGKPAMKSIIQPNVAWVLQHELDHLDGILIRDYVENTHGKSGGILTKIVDNKSSITYAYANKENVSISTAQP